MRITVRDVLEYLAAGMTAEELLADLPERADTLSLSIDMVEQMNRQSIARHDPSGR